MAPDSPVDPTADLLAQVTDALGADARPITRRYRRGHDLVMQGDPDTGVFFLRSGHVVVKVASPSGVSVATTVLGPGDAVGEIAAVTGASVRTATVTALDDVEAVLVPAAQFAAARERRPELDRRMLARFAGRIADLGDRVHEALHETVQRRLERRLVELAALFADGSAAVIPLTQAELGELAGATRPTVNQVLQSLERLGLLGVERGRVVVHDRDALRRHVR